YCVREDLALRRLLQRRDQVGGQLVQWDLLRLGSLLRAGPTDLSRYRVELRRIALEPRRYLLGDRLARHLDGAERGRARRSEILLIEPLQLGVGRTLDVALGVADLGFDDLVPHELPVERRGHRQPGGELRGKGVRTAGLVLDELVPAVDGVLVDRDAELASARLGEQPLDFAAEHGPPVGTEVALVVAVGQRRARAGRGQRLVDEILQVAVGDPLIADDRRGARSGVAARGQQQRRGGRQRRRGNEPAAATGPGGDRRPRRRGTGGQAGGGDARG